MEREYLPRRDFADLRQSTDQRRTFREFVKGLEAIADVDRVTQNFAWCAAQLMGDPDAAAKIGGMIDFAFAYHEAGIDQALAAIEEESGIAVRITVSGRKEQSGLGQTSRVSPTVTEIEGLVVGLIGMEGTPRERIFTGVAVVENIRGQEIFVPVTLNPDGQTTMIHAGFDLESTQASKFLLEAQYPPISRRRVR